MVRGFVQGLVQVLHFGARLQLLSGVMEPAHDGADRDVLGLGNFFIAEPCLGEKDEGGADGEAEAAERGVERPADVGPVEAAGGVVVDGRFEAAGVVVALSAFDRVRTPLDPPSDPNT